MPQRSIIQRREKPSSQSVITPLARQLVAKGEKLTSCFANMRGPAQGRAKYLASELGRSAATAVIDSLAITLARMRPSATGTRLGRGEIQSNDNGWLRLRPSCHR